MLIGINLYPGDDDVMRRQGLAVKALLALKDVEAVNLQFRTVPRASLPGLETLASLATDSAQITGSRARKPITREIFDVLCDAAAARRHHHFAYINSDIVVLPALVDAIAATACDTYAISRCDVDDLIGDPAKGTVLTSGIDMFVVSVEWWRSEGRRFRPYIAGEACWDNVYAAIMMCHSNGRILNRQPLILHERHVSLWNDRSPTARYNGFLAALDARYFSMWCEYWERLEAAREGRSPDADAQAIRERIFVWRRSPAAAMQQSLRSMRARLRFSMA